MATQSKEASVNMKSMLTDLLIGTRKKQLISSTILLIILFLIHVKNKNGNAVEIKLKINDKDKRKVIIQLKIGWKRKC